MAHVVRIRVSAIVALLSLLTSAPLAAATGPEPVVFRQDLAGLSLGTCSGSESITIVRGEFVLWFAHWFDAAGNDHRQAITRLHAIGVSTSGTRYTSHQVNAELLLEQPDLGAIMYNHTGRHRLVSQGAAPDEWLDLNMHFTRTADGETTASFFRLEVVCP